MSDDKAPTINRDVNYVYEKPKPINLFASINEEVRRNAEVNLFLPLIETFEFWLNFLKLKSIMQPLIW